MAHFRSAAFTLLLLFAFLAPLAFASDEWHDWNWHYRVRADVNGSGFAREDWIVEQPINFSALLGSLAPGQHLDPDSIRVIEYDGTTPADEAVSQFDPDSPGSWSGEILWRIDGTFGAADTRAYYIYFDTLENGPKPAPGYAKEVIVQSREQDVRIDTATLMIYMDRTRYGYSHLYRKSYDWQDVGSPDVTDPLGSSRPNVTHYRGFLSSPGEHYCDPGCEWSQANSTTSVLHEGPLRATIVTGHISIERGNGTEARPFNSSNTLQVYAGKPFYREIRTYNFNEAPASVAGFNRRTWIFAGRSMSYAYPSATGVREGSFPTPGTEFSDWNGTWGDSFDGSSGIGDFDMPPAPSFAPHSLWVEADPDAPASYYGALWRPNLVISSRVVFNTIHYFHDGDWRAADVPLKYDELANPPFVGLGNLTNFLLKISVPSVILNWNPTLPVKTEVQGNVTIESVSCRVRSTGSGQVIFEGTLPPEGISIFDVPEGGWEVGCIATDSTGHSSYDTAETRVYDVMSLVKVCCGTLALLFILLLLLSLRIRAGLRRHAKGIPCARCGMPVEPGTPSCPVCGKRLKP